MTTYDMKRRTVSDTPAPCGLMGQISFKRLADMFAMTQETLPGEEITHFEMRGDFLVFRVEKAVDTRHNT